MIADRVKETTTTTGTGNLTLAGAVAQFESFNTAFGTAAPFYYVITDANGADWEVGTGELSNATTLVRTTVHQSSNADAKVNLSAGTHAVFCSAPAVFLSGLAPKSGKLSQFAATTSAELAGVVSDETGSGALVFATSPTLTTPNIGAATATSVNGTTIPSSKTLVVTTDKLSALAATTSAELAGVISDETGTGALVFASSPSLTTPNIGAATAASVNGTTIPSSKTLVVTTDKLSALAATTSAELAGVISDETGSGSLVFATSPALTTPNIGTPSAGTLTNCTGLPVGGVSGLGTGVATALAVNTGSAGAVVVNGGALGTPSSGTLTNATGLPVSTGVSGLGTGVATALAVNTGSAGAVVVNGGALGTPSSGTLTNATGLPVSSGISGFGTGVATALAVNTGSIGAFVVNGGALGTPSSGTVTNLTGTASININGTVGATTPAAGTFTTLTANGNTTLGDASGDSVTINAATVSVPNGLNFDSNTLVIDATNNRVGVGTASPAQALDVTGNVKFSGALYENVYTITDAAAFEINPANGTIQTITLGANRTPAATNFAAGQSVTLMINDGTAYTITWTTVAVTWVGGSAPTLATSGYTVIELWKVGTTIYGAHVGNTA